MTQFALQITKNEARTFTDQIATTPSGKTSKHYKPHKLNGCVLIGRGTTKIFNKIAEKFCFMGITGFDEYRNYLSAYAKQSVKDYFLSCIEEDVPEGWTIEQLMNDFCSRNKQMWQAFNVDVFLIGYSDEYKSFGVASAWSYQDYELQEIYKSDYIFFMQMPPIKKYAAQLGHKPQTKNEMAEGLRRVYIEETKTHKADDVIGGGNIDCTVIDRQGNIQVEDLGPLERPKPELVSKSKPGRNDPCSCGSGLKFKKCCGK